jgi:hypothetical protein
MILLSRFILKGTSQAALVAASMAVLAVIPLLGWVTILISGAAVALMTLVHGYRHGLLVMLAAALGTGVFAGVLFGQPLMALYFLLVVWMPVWLAAVVLRETVSLSLSLLLIAGMGLLALLVMHLVFTGMDGYWQHSLSLQMTQTAEMLKVQLSKQELQTRVDEMIRWLPGLIAGFMLVSTALSLLLARWWQAVNFNPKGFGNEFRALRLGKVTTLASSLVLVISWLLHSDLLFAMAMLMLMLHVLQGMAVIHDVVAEKKMSPVWLYLMYFLMFIPYTIALLVVTGLADAWLDFRRHSRLS